MHPFLTRPSLALLLAIPLALVHASVYVTTPVQSTTCTGGQSCTVQWVDNGQLPLLASIGECEVGLYTGQLVLAQSLPSVDVSATSSFTFTPDPAAGPNGQYYLVFTASAVSYQGFSGSFTLGGMSGTTPGGGSSASTPATTASGSSASAGSTTPVTSPTGTSTGPSVSTPPGSSSPVVGTTTPTGSTPAVGTTPATGSPSIIPTTPTVSTLGSSVAHTTTSSTSASASASPTNAALRVGSSTSLGGVAALLVLSGVLAL